MKVKFVRYNCELLKATVIGNGMLSSSGSAAGVVITIILLKYTQNYYEVSLFITLCIRQQDP